MCKINITLNTTTPTGSSINLAQGRYRKVGVTTWTNFDIINLSAPETPDITGLGSYQLEVRVRNTNNDFSLWSPTSGFEITTTCGDTGGSVITGTTTNLTLYTVQSGVQFDATYSYRNPDNVLVSDYIDGFGSAQFCAITGSVSAESGLSIIDNGPCTTTTTTVTTPTTTYYYVFARECYDGAILQNGVIGNVVLRSTTNITNWSNILVPKFPGDTSGVLQIYASATAQDYNNNVGYFASIDLDTKTGVTQKTDCTYTTTTTTTTVTNSATFSNGTTVSHGHALPSPDPDSTEKAGTLTVTGTKTFKVTIKNEFNGGNYGTGRLVIKTTGGANVGTLVVTTQNSTSVVTSGGSIAVAAGTYSYLLSAELDITSGYSQGAVTATIV